MQNKSFMQKYALPPISSFLVDLVGNAFSFLTRVIACLVPIPLLQLVFNCFCCYGECFISLSRRSPINQQAMFCSLAI
jgi:hypothetical protein